MVIHPGNIRDSRQVQGYLSPDLLFVHICQQRPGAGIFSRVGTGFHREVEEDLLAGRVKNLGRLRRMGGVGENGEGDGRLDPRQFLRGAQIVADVIDDDGDLPFPPFRHRRPSLRRFLFQRLFRRRRFPAFAGGGIVGEFHPFEEKEHRRDQGGGDDHGQNRKSLPMFEKFHTFRVYTAPSQSFRFFFRISQLRMISIAFFN